MIYYLSVQLKSDASFSRGDGIPGMLDSEIEHDAAGCPELGARRLKGLLVEECANLSFALGPERWEPWAPVAEVLFGRSGATREGAARLHIGAASLPESIRNALHAEVRAGRLKRDEVLAALTTIRRQTAMDPSTGAPEHGSLRSIRVLLRDTPLIAPLRFRVAPSESELALLAACVLAVRRGGSGRNRGRGRISLLLHETAPSDVNHPEIAKLTQTHFHTFADALREAP